MTDKVAYLVMRALAGIGGAATIPSAINLIGRYLISTLASEPWASADDFVHHLVQSPSILTRSSKRPASACSP